MISPRALHLLAGKGDFSGSFDPLPSRSDLRGLRRFPRFCPAAICRLRHIAPKYKRRLGFSC